VGRQCTYVAAPQLGIRPTASASGLEEGSRITCGDQSAACVPEQRRQREL